MRILITGATGFVGQYLSARLALNHEVVAVTRQQPDPNFTGEIRHVDSINGQTDWLGVLDDVDIVVHLAARVHVMDEVSSDPLRDFRRVNVAGTAKLAEAAASAGVQRFIFMSSIKVNGEHTFGRPFTASDAPSPRDPYGQSKLEAEHALRVVSERTKMECVVLRAPIVYGVGVKGNIRRVIRLIRARIPIPLGAVNNRRTMLSLENLGIWMDRALGDEVPKDPVLMGDPFPVSTADLVRHISAGMGLAPHVFSVPLPWLVWAAGILRKDKVLDRLIEDLEVAPTFDAYPGIEHALLLPKNSLMDLGLNEHRKTK